jgi:hypothetical protein
MLCLQRLVTVEGTVPHSMLFKRFHLVVFVMVFAVLFAFEQALAQSIDATKAERVVRVGPGRDIKTLANASRVAKDGDLIEVDAGDYLGDVAVWQQSNLTLRAIGGRVRLIASGADAEGKGIWVLRGGQISVEGFDFLGARVSDRNGAGIRLEKGSLTVTNCGFQENENGILTSNNPDVVLKIINSEFGHNGAGDGQSHNLYVGRIKHLHVSGSYFHHARVGHLLKSRAAESFVLYNRLVDGAKGEASYELEFPSGGVAYVIGNVIEQAPTTDNYHLISFGAEGLAWPKNELYLVNNTLIDRWAEGGIFLRVKAGTGVVYAVNNLLVGKGKLDSAGPGEYLNNINVDADEFVDLPGQDYRLRSTSQLLGKAVVPRRQNNVDLKPTHEYVHPRNTRVINAQPLNPGAMQSVASRP